MVSRLLVVSLNMLHKLRVARFISHPIDPTVQVGCERIRPGPSAQVCADHLTDVECVPVCGLYRWVIRCLAIVDCTPHREDGRKRTALIFVMVGARSDVVSKSRTDFKVMRIVDGTVDASARVPRKRRMARDAKHLVAAVDLRDVHTALGALPGVSTKLLHGCKIVRSASVGSRCIHTLNRRDGRLVDGLITPMARAAFTACTIRDGLRHKPSALGRITRDVMHVCCNRFADSVIVNVGVSDAGA